MSLAEKLDRVLTRAEEVRHQLSSADGSQFGTEYIFGCSCFNETASQEF